MNEFQKAFLECALWAEMDNRTEQGGESFDENYSIEDIHPDSLADLLKDCDSFCEENKELLSEAGSDSQNGHDFWLTRNGHGAGFWDRGYGSVGLELSLACKPYGSVYLYVGDDNKIHC